MASGRESGRGSPPKSSEACPAQCKMWAQEVSPTAVDTPSPTHSTLLDALEFDLTIADSIESVSGVLRGFLRRVFLKVFFFFWFFFACFKGLF